MDRRIFGIENEYGITCTFEGQRRLTPDEVARYLFRKVVSWGRSSNVFLSNGSRLYLDVGVHPEYATPECDHVRQLVVHDKAGERIIEGLVADAQERLAEEGIEGEIYVFKNNTDSAGNSYGCHENFLRGPGWGVPAAVRRADPVPGQPPDHLRRRQGRHDLQGRDLLREPARRPHLGGRLLARPPAPGRSSTPGTSRTPTPSVPPPARHRRRLQHERDHDDAQGRVGRPRAADDRGRAWSCATSPWRTRSGRSAR